MANVLVEKLRSYKLTYEIYNFFKRKALKHNIPLYRKYGIKKKYFSSVSSEDFKHLESPLNLFDSLDSRAELPKSEVYKDLEFKDKEALLSWSDHGYVILKEFFDSDEVDQINNTVDMLLEQGKVSWRYGNKIMFAIHQSEYLQSIGAAPRLLKVLDLLMGKETQLFQSINFFKGSQQKAHSDSIHMTTFPYGNLIAVWMALEDIKKGSGELHYYPGSHKLPYVMNRDFDNVGTRFKLGKKDYHDYENHIEKLIHSNKLKKETFLAQKGDILIWHANLLHGGEPVVDDSLTRKSMVFHYYTKDAICYHEVTQRPSLKPISG